MEVWASVACVASIVQFVDVASRCISKSLELQRTSDGVFESNAAVEDVVKHITLLKDEIDTASTTILDPPLHNLCTSVTSTASELLGALKALKVEGSRTKWKTLRKAVRSVWSKEKIQDLEQRLSGFRDELNLHVVVRLRQQLSSMDSDLKTRFQSNNEKLQDILDSILNQRDLFSAVLQQHGQENVKLHAETRKIIHDAHEIAREDSARHQAESNFRQERKHEQIKQLVQSESQRLEQKGEVIQETTLNSIQYSKTEIIDFVELSNDANESEHAKTQSQIVELKEAIRILANQIRARDLELTQILTELNRTKNVPKRKKLGEKSNAVTAAILALETMYSALMSVLATLESSAKNLLDHARTTEVWRIVCFSQKFSSPSTGRTGKYAMDSTDDGAIQLLATSSAEDSIHINKARLLPTSTFTHDNYFSSYYPGISDGAHIVSGVAMQRRWTFQDESVDQESFDIGYEGVSIDRGFCISKPLWLIASVAAVLHEHLPPEEVFRILSITFDERPGEGRIVPNIYSNGYFTGRVKADLKYWNSFARSRGLDSGTEPVKVSLDQMPEFDYEDLRELLRWIFRDAHITYERRYGRPYALSTCTIRLGGFAWQVVQVLKSQGLKINYEDGIIRNNVKRAEIYCVVCEKKVPQILP